MVQQDLFDQQGIADLGPLGGASGARLLDWLKNGYFAAKYYDSAKPWTLVSEYLAADLVSLLGLPIPARRIIPFKEGLWFGSEWRADAKDFSPGMENQLTNPEVVPGMIAFDVWICNRDRNAGNMRFQRPSPGLRKYTVSLIDHSHSLIGDLPDIYELYHRIDEQGDPAWFAAPTPIQLRRLVISVEDFEPWLDKIEGIDPTQLSDTLDAIPSEWVPDSDQSKELVRFIINRAGKVRSLIEGNPELFILQPGQGG